MNTATLAKEESRTDFYPSRGAMKSGIIPRKHPTVWAKPDIPPPVDRVLIDQYERDGFLVLRDVFSKEEVADLQAELARLRQQAETMHRPEVITEKGSRQVRSIFRIHELSTVFEKLAADERLGGLASWLLGDDVYVHQSRLNYKPGFHGKEFYWHSDFETWHVEDGVPAMRMVSCSISLTANTPHNGPLMLIPGSHQRYISCVGATPEQHYRDSLRRQEVGVPDDDSLTQLVNDFGITAPTGLAGAVTFFECNIMHGSNSNITPLPRSNIFIVYNSVDNTPVAPFCGLAPRPNFIAERQDFTPLPYPAPR